MKYEDQMCCDNEVAECEETYAESSARAQEMSNRLMKEACDNLCRSLGVDPSTVTHRYVDLSYLRGCRLTPLVDRSLGHWVRLSRAQNFIG